MQELTTCRHGHFDFLKLPLELREAIYELLFEDRKHYPPSKLRCKVRASRIRRGANVYMNSVHDRPLATGILRTCQQIYYEARSVLYRMRPAQIRVGFWTKNKYFLNPIDTAPLANARNLSSRSRGRKARAQYNMRRNEKDRWEACYPHMQLN